MKARAVHADWITLLLLAAIVALAASALAVPGWCRDCSPLAAASTLGALYGLALAVSRFRGRSAALLSAVTSSVIVVQMAGQVAPSLDRLLALPPGESVWIAHVRLLTLFAQWTGELHAISTAKLATSGLFLVGMAWTAWNVGAWLIWFVLRREWAWAGLLPYALLIAAHIRLNGKDQPFPWLLVGVATLLLVRTAMTGRRRDWERRGVDYPDFIGDYWASGGVAIAIAVTAAAWISTPETLATLRDWFTIKSLPAVGTPASHAATPGAQQTRAPGLRLESPGTQAVSARMPASLSQETVMWVQVDDPPPEVGPNGIPLAPTTPHYWRGAIFARYDGSNWTRAEQTGEPREFGAAPAPGRYVLSQTFEILVPHDRQLYAVNMPVGGGAGTSLSLSGPERSPVLLGDAMAYSASSWATRVDERQLRADSTVYPADLGAYQQLPPALPQRVRDLAARVVAGAGNPYDKARLIEAYLRSTYLYRLDVDPPPPGSDAVDYFLFEAPGGFCTYYASAMVLMLRSQNVPARVVTGFATGEYDLARRAYRVAASDAHAWVEVYFPSYGWVEFEPTSSRTPFRYPENRPPLTPAPVDPGALGARWLAQPLPAQAVEVLALALLALSAWWLVRAWRLAPRTPAGQAYALYWEMRAALAQAGLAAPPSATPNEFLAGHVEQLSRRPRMQAALQEATRLYVAAVFTRQPPERAQVRAAQRAWRRAWPQWLLLRLQGAAKQAR